MRFYNIDMNILIELSDHSNRLIKDKNTNYGAQKEELADCMCMCIKMEKLDKNGTNFFSVYLNRSETPK